MSKNKNKNFQQLRQENEDLKRRLTESEDTLNAIRNGEVDAIVVSSQEKEKIFSLTSAETPYRILIEEMEEGAVTISEEGTILYCNKIFSKLVSIPMEQIIGSNFNRFINGKGYSEFLRVIKDTLKCRIKEEIIYINNQEDVKYLHLSYSAMPPEVSGKICIIVSDITELKRHQQNLQSLVAERTLELENANEKLKESNATKDKLFSIIAHDLRNPFNSLLGFSELLIENLNNYDMEQIEKILKHINTAAKSAFSLLENLLLWAMSKNDKLQFNPDVVNLAPVLKEVTTNLRSLSLMKDITLHLLPSYEVIGYADVNMIRTVLRNLITNAIKFTNPGGEIKIDASSNDREFEISITDNGIGMSEEIKNNLFNIEINKSTTGTASEKGTGLGLILCKEFVEKHGGKIIVESRICEGSTFKIILPQKEMVLVESGEFNDSEKGQ